MVRGACGSLAAGAVSLILMALGTGVGLSSLSPRPSAGLEASKVGYGAIVWIIFVQISASALGGYLAGRLRTRWVALHTHEVYFRDTAHGFLVWAVSLVISALFFVTYANASINAMGGGGSASADAQMVMGETPTSWTRSFVPTTPRTQTTNLIEPKPHLFLRTLCVSRIYLPATNHISSHLFQRGPGSAGPKRSNASLTRLPRSDRRPMQRARPSPIPCIGCLWLC